LLGKFCEHLHTNILHGMEAQILLNPTFGVWPFSAGDRAPDGGIVVEHEPDRIDRAARGYLDRRGLPCDEACLTLWSGGLAFGWTPTGAAEVLASPDVGPFGDRAQRIEVGEGLGGLAQEPYLPLHRTRRYEVRLVARAVAQTELHLRLGPVEAIVALDPTWRTVDVVLELPGDVPADGLVPFSLTCQGPANLVLDRVLLYPDDHVGHADADVVRLLRESRLPLLRWPGGNFVSGYDWRDGVGPVDARPTLPNPAWGGLESNLFGTAEFVAFCRAVGCEPMICVNAGNGTADEAAAWVEYCNGGPETPMGRLRAEHGHAEPFGIRLWEVGNENYGRWQCGWTTPGGYVDRYHRFAAAMRAVDPTIELLACGHFEHRDDAWNKRLLAEAADEFRILTDHILTGGQVTPQTDPAELLGAFLGLATVVGQEYRDLRQRMLAAGIDNPKVAITELQLFAHLHRPEGEDGPLTPATMPTPPTLAEALYDATLIFESIRQGGFVAMITHSATVNHGGGLRKARERVWANPCHWGHAMAAELVGGAPLPVEMECASYSTAHRFGRIPPLTDVPVLDAMTVRHDDRVVLMLVNRGAEPVALALDLGGLAVALTADVVTLTSATPYEQNTLDEPERVAPVASELAPRDGQWVVDLPPWSLVRVTFRLA
jgi:alpha-N-arabinofuranosidase